MEKIKAIKLKDGEVGTTYLLTKTGNVITDLGDFGVNVFDCTLSWNQSEYLRYLREDKKLTQAQMATILGMSRPTYIGKEQGRHALTHTEWLISKLISNN